MFFYIALSVFSIVIVCMLIGFIKFRRGKFDSHFVPFILNEKAVKALKSSKGVSVKTLEQISNLVIAQVTLEGMLMAWYLSISGGDNDMGHGLVLAIAGVRLGFGYWITHMLKKETSAAK